MSESTPTPETDAAMIRGDGGIWDIAGVGPITRASFARSLEQRLTESHAEIARLRDALDEQAQLQQVGHPIGSYWRLEQDRDDLRASIASLTADKNALQELFDLNPSAAWGQIQQLTAERDQLRAERDEARKGVELYATAARVIMLHLAEFCDPTLSPDLDIADAARCASACLDERRAEINKVADENAQLRADAVVMHSALEKVNPSNLWDKARMHYTGPQDSTIITDWHRKLCDEYEKALADHPGSELLAAVARSYEILRQCKFVSEEVLALLAPYAPKQS